MPLNLIAYSNTEMCSTQMSSVKHAVEFDSSFDCLNLGLTPQHALIVKEPYNEIDVFMCDDMRR